MNPYEMVVAIIFLVTVGRIIQSRYRHRGQPTEVQPAEHGETAQLRAEMRQLKERIQVLERVITDNHGSVDLDRQIEQLRDR